MKRTSLWIALLALTPTIAQAWCYNSFDCRVRYSPYAFDYQHSGLIPGGLKYSPYIQGWSSPPLVYQGARYSPYAFSYNNPGLVVDYCLCPILRCAPVCISGQSGLVGRARSNGPVARRWRGRDCPTTRQTRAYSRSARAGSESSAAPEEDSLQVIRRYLDQRDVGNVAVNHILKIDGRLVTANFTLRDRNLIVTYWNPQEIESLRGKADFKQKVFERYRRDWQRLAETHKRNGGNVYYVEASGKERILAALDSCDQLGPGGDVPKRTTLYARQ